MKYYIFLFLVFQTLHFVYAQSVDKNGRSQPAITTAVQSKLDLKSDLASPSFTGSPFLLTGSTGITQTVGNNTSAIATTAFVTASVAAVTIQNAYPVGTIYFSTISINPSISLGFGTWIAFGQGRVLLGDGGGYSAGSTGGSADAVNVSHGHTFTGNTLSPHNHEMYRSNAGYSGGGADMPIADPLSGNTSNTLVTTAGLEISAVTPSGAISVSGVSGTNANLQPYIVVYMWNRTN